MHTKKKAGKKKGKPLYICTPNFWKRALVCIYTGEKGKGKKRMWLYLHTKKGCVCSYNGGKKDERKDGKKKRKKKSGPATLLLHCFFAFLCFADVCTIDQAAMRKGAKEKEKRERRKKGAEDAPGCIQKQSGKVKTKTQTPFYFSAFLSPFLPPHRCAGCGGVEKGKKKKKGKKGKEKQNKRKRERKGKRKTLLSFSRAKGKTRRKSRHHFLVEMAGPPLKRAITTTFKVKETIGKSGCLCAVWLAR